MPPLTTALETSFHSYVIGLTMSGARDHRKNANFVKVLVEISLMRTKAGKMKR